jgi:hypothetical protein
MLVNIISYISENMHWVNYIKIKKQNSEQCFNSLYVNQHGLLIYLFYSVWSMGCFCFYILKLYLHSSINFLYIIIYREPDPFSFWIFWDQREEVCTLMQEWRKRLVEYTVLCKHISRERKPSTVFFFNFPSCTNYTFSQCNSLLNTFSPVLYPLNSFRFWNHLITTDTYTVYQVLFIWIECAVLI